MRGGLVRVGDSWARRVCGGDHGGQAAALSATLRPRTVGVVAHSDTLLFWPSSPTPAPATAPGRSRHLRERPDRRRAVRGGALPGHLQLRTRGALADGGACRPRPHSEGVTARCRHRGIRPMPGEPLRRNLASVTTTPHTARLLLRGRQASPFLGAVLVCGFGSSTMALAAGVWVKELTASDSLAALATAAPWAAVPAGPWLGAVADRLPRGPLLVRTSLAAAGLLLLLAAAGAAGLGRAAVLVARRRGWTPRPVPRKRPAARSTRRARRRVRRPGRAGRVPAGRARPPQPGARRRPADGGGPDTRRPPGGGAPEPDFQVLLTPEGDQRLIPFTPPLAARAGPPIGRSRELPRG